MLQVGTKSGAERQPGDNEVEEEENRCRAGERGGRAETSIIGGGGVWHAGGNVGHTTARSQCYSGDGRRKCGAALASPLPGKPKPLPPPAPQTLGRRRVASRPVCSLAVFKHFH